MATKRIKENKMYGIGYCNKCGKEIASDRMHCADCRLEIALDLAIEEALDTKTAQPVARSLCQEIVTYRKNKTIKTNNRLGMILQRVG